MNFVVLSSSRGTTFQAVIDRMKDGTLTATCAGLIADREDRGCVAKARAGGLPVVIVEKKEGESREQYDQRLHHEILHLSGSGPGSEFILAALGWFSIFSPWFIEQWRNRII